MKTFKVICFWLRSWIKMLLLIPCSASICLFENPHPVLVKGSEEIKIHSEKWRKYKLTLQFEPLQSLFVRSSTLISNTQSFFFSSLKHFPNVLAINQQKEKRTLPSFSPLICCYNQIMYFYRIVIYPLGLNATWIVWKLNKHELKR